MVLFLMEVVRTEDWVVHTSKNCSYSNYAWHLSKEYVVIISCVIGDNP